MSVFDVRPGQSLLEQLYEASGIRPVVKGLGYEDAYGNYASNKAKITRSGQRLSVGEDLVLAVGSILKDTWVAAPLHLVAAPGATAGKLLIADVKNGMEGFQDKAGDTLSKLEAYGSGKLNIPFSSPYDVPHEEEAAKRNVRAIDVAWENWMQLPTSERIAIMEASPNKTWDSWANTFQKTRHDYLTLNTKVDQLLSSIQEVRPVASVPSAAAMVPSFEGQSGPLLAILAAGAGFAAGTQAARRTPKRKAKRKAKKKAKKRRRR